MMQNLDVFVSWRESVVTHLASNSLIKRIWWYSFSVCDISCMATLHRSQPWPGSNCKHTLISFICLLWIAYAMYNSSTNSLLISAYKLTYILCSSWISNSVCTQWNHSSTSARLSLAWEERSENILCFWNVFNHETSKKKKKRNIKKTRRRRRKKVARRLFIKCSWSRATPHCCACQLWLESAGSVGDIWGTVSSRKTLKTE